MFYSPFRYPGGKNQLAKIIADICKQNCLTQHFVEPYAGGASVGLYLLFTEQVSKITINDYDRSIYAFWHAVIHETQPLCKLISQTEINLDNWEKAKQIQKNKKWASLLSLGFSTLFLNRTNRSGIIEAGPIGGKRQENKYKIDCRFNKKEIIQRIKRIAMYKVRIQLENRDALEFIKTHDQKDVIFYLDPPYYLKGHNLYVHHYKHQDHEALRDSIQKIQHAYWILSYDNAPVIKSLYQWLPASQKREYKLFHRVSTKKQGEEILLCSKHITLEKIHVGTSELIPYQEAP